MCPNPLPYRSPPYSFILFVFNLYYFCSFKYSPLYTLFDHETLNTQQPPPPPVDDRETLPFHTSCTSVWAEPNQRSEPRNAPGRSLSRVAWCNQVQPITMIWGGAPLKAVRSETLHCHDSTSYVNNDLLKNYGFELMLLITRLTDSTNIYLAIFTQVILRVFTNKFYKIQRKPTTLPRLDILRK